MKGREGVVSILIRSLEKDEMFQNNFKESLAE